MYYTYILRCADNSLYTGITTDLKRRMSEHSNSSRSARYTLAHQVLSLEAAWRSENRALASRLEYRIKRLTKAQKEELISSGRLSDLLADSINTEDYIPCDIGNI